MNWKVSTRVLIIISCLIASCESWTLIVGRQQAESYTRLEPEVADSYDYQDATAFKNISDLYLLRTISSYPLPEPTLKVPVITDGKVDLTEFQEQCEEMYLGELRSTLEAEISYTLSTHTITLLSEVQGPKNTRRRHTTKMALDQLMEVMRVNDPPANEVHLLCKYMAEVVLDMLDPQD